MSLKDKSGFLSINNELHGAVLRRFVCPEKEGFWAVLICCDIVNVFKKFGHNNMFNDDDFLLRVDAT